MWQLTSIELYKIFRRPRTYISFAAITALIGAVQLGLKVDGNSYVDFMVGSISSLEIEGNILNGYLVCYIILQMLLVQVPLLVTLIAADMISGEANMGTLRLVLTKPFSRTQWLLSKFFAASIYTLLLLTWMACMALFGSMLIFGTDDMMLLKSSYIVILDDADVFWRYVGAFGFAAVSMVAVAALGFLLSIFSENSIGPIVTTMSIIVFLTVLSTMNIPFYNYIRPYLFVTHMNNWKEFFDVQVNAENQSLTGTIQNSSRIINSIIVLLLHIVAFVGAAVVIFKKKDITT
ncbi:MAG: ABC transporter permease [Chitinophagaceae bacterium]